jgi:hypothetical protein
MNVVQTSFTVAQFCQSLAETRVKVNKTYQRNDKVWSTPAQSFLIETLVKGFPIPKLFTHLRTNLKTKTTVEEIVDGQQRAQAIFDFFSNELRLSRKCSLPSLRGKKYEELDEDDQTAFLEYKLPVDQLLEASDEAVREVFLRINSHTASLNAEETRHASFQGEFKWFMVRCSEKYADTLKNMGVFTDKQLIRMQELKLLTEYYLSLEQGLVTTKSKDLDRFYDQYDEDFEADEEYERKLQVVLETIFGWPEIHGTPLMRPHVFLSLMQATMHAQEPVTVFEDVRAGGTGLKGVDDVQPALLQMAADLDDPDAIPKKATDRTMFVEASASKTNVREQRQIRFTSIFDAIADA